MIHALANTFPASKISRLKDRAAMLAQVRQFFAERQVTEVDCPALSKQPSIDANIESIKTEVCGETLYLHTSPEVGMKPLLSAGLGDIYQLSHVFRQGERGARHTPEFSMIEWYRLGFSFQQMIDETVELISLFVGELSAEQMTYAEAFQRFASSDEIDELKSQLSGAISDEDLPHLILSHLVEPKLQELTVITHFPKTQAALARLDGDCALRFEIFYRGLELANGYDELTDPIEHAERGLPLFGDLPSCCGVSVGFDRLMMLRHGVSDIRSVQSA